MLSRKPHTCNFLELRDTKIVYKRYASLFFVCGISAGDNELCTLEIIHRFVETLDRYFGNVTELDLIFNFQQAYAVMDEVLVAGELADSSKASPLKQVAAGDTFETMDALEVNLRDAGL